VDVDAKDRIDPQVRARLDQYLSLVGPQGLSGIDSITARRGKQAELAALRPRAAAHHDVDVRDFSIRSDTSPDSAVQVRVYRPAGSTVSAPCICYVHGGGMVTGSVDGDDAKAAELARATNCVVVSVEYRLAPEHPYPAAIDGCFTALAWIAEGRHELGIDLRRIALYGPSAGGCLATATTLLARDRGGPEIACLVLVSPMLDDRASTPSSFANTGFGTWGREANLQAWEAYLGEDFGTDRVSPYAAPARADDLTRLPPTYVDVGDLDLFRDEAMDFAQRLMRAGVPVEPYVYPGGIHGGESLAPSADLTVRVRSRRHSALRRTLRVRSSAAEHAGP
jgi:acetyl esterase/lipase